MSTIGVSGSEPSFGSTGADLPPRLVEMGEFACLENRGCELENRGFADWGFPPLKNCSTGIVKCTQHAHNNAAADTWRRDRYINGGHVLVWLDCKRVCVSRERSESDRFWHFPVKKAPRGVPRQKYPEGFPIRLP